MGDRGGRGDEDGSRREELALNPFEEVLGGMLNDMVSESTIVGMRGVRSMSVDWKIFLPLGSRCKRNICTMCEHENNKESVSILFPVARTQ